MSVPSSLLTAAMIGTEKHPVEAPVLPGEIGVLVSQIAEGARANSERLMSIQALLSACARAGGRGRSANGMHRLTPAPVESVPEADGPNEKVLLQWVFEEGSLFLQFGVCVALAGAHKRLPELVLPAALDAGQKSRDLRPVLSACIGERGRWLARLNPSWKFAAGASAQASDDERWSEGSLDERRLLLFEQRQQAPAVARERLQAALPELPARERLELLGPLQINLSSDDESLLTALLADRSGEVKKVAAGMLSALPQSALAQRAAARIDALLTAERRKLRRGWTIEAPETFDEAWKADVIEGARPNGESLGERAWWLYQLAREVPLSWWSTRLQMTPAELLKWATAGQWAEALLRAWRDALQFSRDSEWCEALLDDWPKKLPGEPRMVLAMLPLARREKYWETQIAGSWLGRSVPLGTAMREIVSGCALGDRLSPNLSRKIVTRLSAELQSDAASNDWSLREASPELAVLVARESLDELNRIEVSPEATPAPREAQQRVRKVIEVRTTFRF